jgi:hypothetical protein
MIKKCTLTSFFALVKRSEEHTPKIGEPTFGFILHDNAPTHRSVLVKDFVAKNNVTTLEHPTYSLDLAAADFLPVPSTEISIEGTALL